MFCPGRKGRQQSDGRQERQESNYPIFQGVRQTFKNKLHFKLEVKAILFSSASILTP